MAAPKSKAPPWSDAFRNILKLEESRGFNNTAVAGGLDKFVQRWSSDMAGQATDSSDAHFLLNEPYGSMSTDVRARWALQWRQTIGDDIEAGVSAADAAAPTAGGNQESVAPTPEVKPVRAPKAPPPSCERDSY